VLPARVDGQQRGVEGAAGKRAVEHAGVNARQEGLEPLIDELPGKLTGGAKPDRARVTSFG
jgi:hypothetical protein